MDELVNFTLDQVALEGPVGCSVARLEKVMEEHLPLTLGMASFETLPPLIWEWLWELLLSRKKELQFCRLAQEAAGKLKSPEAEKMVDYAAPLSDNYDLSDLNKLDKEYVRLVASQSLRDRALGIFDEVLSTFKISGVQRTVLEILGARRNLGALRTELSKRLEMDSSKFHYVLKLLEARRLITMNPILAKDEASKLGHGVQTAIVHLRRYSPRLAEGQIFKEVAGAAPGVFGVSDDNNRQMKRICNKLAEAADHTLLEADLKAALGFRKTEGHRAWRRLRSQMEKSGYIQIFQATFGGPKKAKGIKGEPKPKTLIKLLRPFTGKSAGKVRRPIEDDDDDEDLQPINLIAEKGFDWQVVDLVIQAGKRGIHKHKIARHLGVSMKKMKNRMDDIHARFGILETHQQDGKQVVKNWVAPPSLLKNRAIIQAVPQPPGGYMAAVLDAVASSQLPQNLNSLALAQPTAADPAATSSAQAGQAQQMELEMPGISGREINKTGMDIMPMRAQELILGEEDIGGGLINRPRLSQDLEREGPLEEPQEPTVTPDLPVGDEMPELPQDLLEDNSKVTVCNQGYFNPANANSKPTVLSDDRLARLLKKVEEDQFILRVHLPSFFLAAENPESPSKTHLDRRTVMRVVDRGILKGKLAHYSVHVPSQRSGYQDETIYVVVDAKVEVEGNNQLLLQIRKAQRENMKQRFYGGPYRPVYGDVQHIDSIDRLKEPAVGRKERKLVDDEAADEVTTAEMNDGMWENGFIQARMVRARLLHEQICKLIGLAGYSTTGLHNALGRSIEDENKYREPSPPAEDMPEGPFLPAEKAAGTLFTFSVDESARDLPEPKTVAREKKTLEQLAESNKGLFTFQALWSEMPLDLYCQSIGTHNRHPAIRELFLRGPKMGELTPQEVDAIVDVHAKKRMNNLLDLLHRMGLIKPYIYSSNPFFTRAERSVFIARPDVCFQEPKPIPKSPANPDGPVELEEVKYDLRTEEDLTNYWTRLEYDCTTKGEAMLTCMPVRDCAEMRTAKAWNRDRLVRLDQWFKLQDRVKEKVDTFNYKDSQTVADELNLSYDQVQKLAHLIRGKVGRNLAKTGVRLPKLQGFSGGRAPKPAAPVHEKNAKRYQEKLQEWKKGRASKSKANQPFRRRPWEPEESSVAEEKDGQDENEDDNDDEEEEEDEEEALNELEDSLGLSVGLAPRALRKKFLWTAEEDRFVLQNFVKWHAVQGFKELAFRSQLRPMVGSKLKERQGYRRISWLADHSATKGKMDLLRSLVEEVYQRGVKRQGGEAAIAIQLKKYAEEKMKEKKRARLQRQKMLHEIELAKQAGLPAPSEPPLPSSISLAMKFPDLPAGQLFAFQDEMDEAAHARALELIDEIIAVGPRRLDESKPRRNRDSLDGALKRKGSRLAVGLLARPPKKPKGEGMAVSDIFRRRRVQGERTFEQHLQRMVSKRAQARSRLLQEEETPPTSPIAVAAELIKSLLSVADTAQSSAPDRATALVRRFTEEQISTAFAYLRRRNFVYHGGSKRPFNLSNDFKAALQVPELPADVFEEAAAAAHQMENSDTGTLVIKSNGSELPGGLVAELLGMMATDSVTFGLPSPAEAQQALTARKPKAAVRAPVLRTIQPIFWDITVDISQATPALPQGLQAKSWLPVEDPPPCFDPQQAFKDESARRTAWVACYEAASNPGSSVPADLLRIVYKELDAMGSDGPSLDALSSKLEQPVAAVKTTVQFLQSYGLVCKVPGYTDWAFVNTEHSGSFYVDVEQDPSRAGSHEGIDNRIKERGSRLLMPWLDHKGTLNAKFWRALVTRIMAVVITQPGIKEDDLIGEMSCLTPFSVKQLVETLMAQQMLLCELCKSRKAGPPAIFRNAPPRPVKMIRHYFVDPRNYMSRTHTVLPL